ncbi:serine/arginine repetitive matrix protein 2 isoform X2 [Musca domestica]|uniref:Serine/arginine repetitive matrix protein 2 isoform X2 n=1 Tax=Musca domestica TaxID=7370 RepID=A0A1I8N0Z4_MUSDO|nr:serine/arginine repetitive matrix protein 2 isoform X2 [Musca domestica]
MTSTLCKIHVNNSTGVSLNERFTAITTQPKVTVAPARSRSRSVERAMPRVDQATSRANQRLLAELQRKHKLQTAMKLKRRSMRTVGGGTGGGAYGRIKRGSVKALRVGANGKPIRTNSLSNIATMNADREILKRRASPAPLRRSNSSGNLANRLGPRRPVVGGAAQRVARRRIERQRGGVIDNRGRSLVNGRRRSRSRTRIQENGGRGRSRSRQNNGAAAAPAPRGRSRSRSRNPVRSRSLSRNRGRDTVAKKSALPIKARLGVRPGEANNAPNQKNRNRRRTASLSVRGVQTGRIQKRRNSANTTARSNGRPRSRSITRATNGQNPRSRSRSRSRTRKGQVGQTRNGQGQSQQKKGIARGQTQQRGGRGQAQPKRGRSQQRRRGINSAQKGSNNSSRRGRSRSRTGGRGGQRSQGKNDPYVKQQRKQ